jgi:hypothetical protein
MAKVVGAEHPRHVGAASASSTRLDERIPKPPDSSRKPVRIDALRPAHE